MLKKILSIRLSYIYPILFIAFMIILSYFQPQELSSGQLALYSVNSFLFGFYFSPMLDGQKSRVNNLIAGVRSESMVVLDILTQSHLLEEKDRHQLKVRLAVYLKSIIDNLKIRADNIYYDELLHFTQQAKYKNNEVMATIYERVSKTQENRDAIQNTFMNKVYSHEWLITLVLFTITIYFAMNTDYSGLLFFRLLLAILCTGLCLMVIILAKYATLTHKQAKRMWTPLHELYADHFDDITADEVSAMKQKIDDAQ